MFLADGVRSQKRNQAGKLLADSVSAAFEPEALVLEAAGKARRCPPSPGARRTSIQSALSRPSSALLLGLSSLIPFLFLVASVAGSVLAPGGDRNKRERSFQ